MLIAILFTFVTAPSPSVTSAPSPVEIQCVDGSTLKVTLLDDKIGVMTKYGRLDIPAADIRRLDFATRLSAETTARIDLLIANLNHPDYESREKAMAELRGMKESAYPALVKAVKNPDAEISRRAEESVKHIQQRVVLAKLEPRPFDTIITDDQKITGMIIPSTLRVRTGPFGDQTLKLTDVTTLSSGPTIGVTIVNAPVAPGNLMAYQNQAGKELAFTVTAPATLNGTSLWGTDIYTLDSNLAQAAIHAGLVKLGGTAVVQVRVIPSPMQFTGSARNDVTSAPYGAYPNGAFEFIK